jgi:hypothetical protein
MRNDIVSLIIFEYLGVELLLELEDSFILAFNLLCIS